MPDIRGDEYIDFDAETMEVYHNAEVETRKVLYDHYHQIKDTMGKVWAQSFLDQIISDARILWQQDADNKTPGDPTRPVKKPIQGIVRRKTTSPIIVRRKA